MRISIDIDLFGWCADTHTATTDVDTILRRNRIEMDQSQARAAGQSRASYGWPVYSAGKYKTSTLCGAGDI
jgi:hypothetical protein